MKEPKEDDRIVMVGASFDEIEAVASLAVERELDKQIQKVMPTITEALNHGAASLNFSNAALVAARDSLMRYRLALFVLVVLCAAEGGFIATLIMHRGWGH